MVCFTKWLFIYATNFLIPLLPRKAYLWLGDLIGRLSRNSYQAQITRRELSRYLGPDVPPEEIARIAVKGMGDYKKDLFEIWELPRLSKPDMAQYAFIDGREHLDRVLEQGKGAVLGVTHFGSWKMLIACLAYAGYPINQIGIDPRRMISPRHPMHHNLVMQLEYRFEESIPANFLYIKGNNLRPAFKALLANEVVVSSIDGMLGPRRVELDFLHLVNKLNMGPVLLALRTRAPLLPCFAIRQEDQRHRVVLHPPLPLDYDDSDSGAAGLRGLRAFNTLFQEQVSRHPSLYSRRLFDHAVTPEYWSQ